MTVLVTGGGGFLGRAIVEALLAEGEIVRSYSRRRYPELEAMGVTCIQGDLSDQGALEAAADGCTTVFHVAALPGIWGAYETYYSTNTLGTRHVIEACRKLRVSKLVYTSTPSVVHGGDDIEGADESLPYPAHFEAPYPETKALAEREVLAANCAELSTVALRPHLIWGPGDNHLLPRIMERAKTGRLRFLGPPSPLVDSTYIVDGARAHILAAKALGPNSACAGKAYFISQGEPWPADRLINGLLAAVGMRPVARYLPPGFALILGAIFELVYRVFRITAEPPMTRFLAKQLSTAHWYDISAAERDFGFVPAFSISSALNELRHHWAERHSERTHST